VNKVPRSAAKKDSVVGTAHGTSHGAVQGPQIIFSGIEPDAASRRQIKDIGGRLLEAGTLADDIKNSKLATHLVMDKFKRTPKMLMAINEGAYAVKEEWMVDSAARKVVGGISLEEEPSYILDDKDGKPMTDVMKMRRRANIFEDYAFLITTNVAGNKAPKEEELKAIIESGGGTYLGTKPLKKFDPPLAEGKTLLVISTTDAWDSLSAAIQEKYRAIARDHQHGDIRGIYLLEWILSGCATQRVDLSSHVLESIPSSSSSSSAATAKSTKAKKGK